MIRRVASAALLLSLLSVGIDAPILGQDPEGAMGSYPLPAIVGMTETVALHDDVYVISQEEPYGGSGGGILFFQLQREGRSDRATLSIDGDLPLAQSLRALRGKRCILRLFEGPSRDLQELKRR